MSVHHTDALHISRRYATAIFALAVEAKAAPVVVAELSTLAGAIEASPELTEALANPLVSHAQKAAVLAALIAKANSLTQRAVATIAHGGRASLTPVIAQQLRACLSEHQGQVAAIVTSARALPAATQKQLMESLATATGKTVQLDLREDASVLGGVRIEIGSLRLDATLAGALNSMREQLLAPTH